MNFEGFRSQRVNNYGKKRKGTPGEWRPREGLVDVLPGKIIKMPATDVETSKHRFVLENGKAVNIERKYREDDQFVLCLSNGEPRRFALNDPVPVVDRIVKNLL